MDFETVKQNGSKKSAVGYGKQTRPKFGPNPSSFSALLKI